MATGKVLGSNESADGHHGVVVDVQERHLPLVLTQDKEHRVQELDYLAHVVQPHGTGHLKVSVVKVNDKATN